MSFLKQGPVAGLLLCVLALPGWGMDLHEVEARALEGAPKSLALGARAEALRREAVAASALPDPELSLGAQGVPVDSFSTRDEMMTMFHLGVRQRFPAAGSRSLTRNRGELQADQLGVEEQLYRLEVLREVRELWLDWSLAVQAVAIIDEVEQRLQVLEALVDRRLEAGTATRADRSRARLERLGVRERLLEQEAEAGASRAQLAEWVQAPLDQPGHKVAWPAPNADAISAELDTHPELQARSLDVRIGDTDAELAGTEYRPSWMVELGYGWRRGSDPMTGDSRSDMASAMVSMSLPVFTSGRQDQRLASARAGAEAARFDLADQRRQLLTRLGKQRALWERYQELVEWYERELVPAAADTRSAQVDAYRNDRSTLEAVISAELDELQYRLRALQARRQRDAARVRLLYLEGV